MQLVLVLHAHLPWVKAARPWSVEERWLHEALWESYLPLLGMIDRLADDGVTAPLTLSLSPTLLSMWADPTLRNRFADHLSAVTELAGGVLDDVLADHYLGRLRRAEASRRRHDADLGRAFGDRHRRGRIELLTTAASHALLPALAPCAGAIEAQLGLGRDLFERATGVSPRAMWLPECAISTEVELALARLDVGLTVVAEHACRFARPDPGGLGGGPTPVVSPRGIVAMPRDRPATLRVWSARDGYPGHPAYREFHRDLGHESRELGPFGWGTMTGLKPYRIDGGVYVPEVAARQARRDAEALLHRLADRDDALVVMAFDAELFGHWWHEGLSFLEHLLRHASAAGVEVVSLSDAAARQAWPVAEPAASTWGRGGDSHTWLGPVTAGHWRLVHRVWEHANRAWRRGEPDAIDVARAALLLQASDWPFLIDGAGSAAYARRRVGELVAAVEGKAVVDEPFDADLVRRWMATARLRCSGAW